MNRDELVDLVTDALGAFGHAYCPHCQAYIGLDKYVTENDIEDWIEDMVKKGESKWLNLLEKKQ